MHKIDFNLASAEIMDHTHSVKVKVSLLSF